MSKLQGCVYSMIPFRKTHLCRKRKGGNSVSICKKKYPACDTVFGFFSISTP